MKVHNIIEREWANNAVMNSYLSENTKVKTKRLQK